MTERVFKRKIYDQILSWKNENNGKSALLIEGARCVGKSTIVEEFATLHACGRYASGRECLPRHQ